MSNLKNNIEKFKDLKLLVIGDIMLDSYIIGDTERISQEAPVPVVHVREEKHCLGGAGNVISNLVSLGVECEIIGRIGNGIYGKVILDNFEKLGVKKDNIIIDDMYPTIRKSRIMSMNQQVMRFDHEKVHDLTIGQKGKISKYISETINEYDGIVISDYGKGLVNSLLISDLSILFSKKINTKIFIDPALNTNKLYCKIPNSYVLPNEIESKYVNLDYFDHKIITIGEKGIKLTSEKNNIKDLIIPPLKIEMVYDTVGAGDTVTSTFSSAICSGIDIVTACKISNLAASISISNPGTYSVSIKELKKILDLKNETNS